MSTYYSSTASIMLSLNHGLMLKAWIMKVEMSNESDFFMSRILQIGLKDPNTARAKWIKVIQ